MSRISIKRSHNMGKDDVHTMTDEMGKKLVAKFGGNYQWEENAVHYKYSGGVDAWLSFDEEAVNVDVKLGLFMLAMKDMIKTEIEKYLDEHLA